MPITISRKGDLIPVSSGQEGGSRNEAWARIIRGWAEKNEEQFREMLKGTEPEREEKK